MVKPINQLTKEGLFIKTFISTKDAAEELGIKANSISAVLNGVTKTAGGFKFEYNIPDLKGEVWYNGLVNSVDVYVSNFGRIRIYGKITDCNGVKDKIIHIQDKKYSAARLIYAIGNGLSYDDLPKDHYVQRKNRDTTDHNLDNLELVHRSDLDTNHKKKAETLSQTIELVECDKNGKLCYDDNNKEIILREYSSITDASDKSGEYTGKQ